MNELSTIICTSLLAMLGYMTFWFLIATLAKRNDIADTAWGLGFVYIATISLFNNTNPDIVAWTAYILTVIWGLRLAIHVFSRNKGKKEDFRYAQWRKDWGKFFLIRSYFQVFLLQGLLLILVATPVILATRLSTSLDVSAWYLAGLIVWIFGFYFEAVGDWQLSQYIKQKIAGKKMKSKIMDHGLWKYTRHPNYFGEVVQWWGQWILLASSAVAVGYKYLGLTGPVTITILILFVSGIPLLEKKYAHDKEYQAYAKKTNKFFPWNPKD
ncbi:DUF1295 domain-containing protein [Candidatus Saccharibacteria bacterium]|nr:DUF1295 domain-containing protein [Candidatus Saccharibacteria bacterium]